MPGFLVFDAWRRRPLLMRQVLPPELLKKFDREKIKRIVSRLAHIRVFTSGESAPVARLVPKDQADYLLARLMSSTLKYTLLLNKVDEVDHDVISVRAAFGVPYSWRADDVVVTWSTQGSGIGYHAGHEDAIIVQTSGRRHWRVWSASEVDAASRRRILISAPGDNKRIFARGAPALLDCELEPGDALYIPPFFPHEGLSLSDSFSIALGWRGVAYFHIAQALSADLHLPGDFDAEGLPGGYFDLIRDMDPACWDASMLTIADGIAVRLLDLGYPVSDVSCLPDRIRFMLKAGVA